jgi:DNA-binding NtrC family response regulator
MQALYGRIARVAPTDATVLILGERGTGKELVARAIQRRGKRRDRPFVIVNCGALPRELLVSELFGHERGAFTGALERKRGLVTEAAGGTLFLDEIGDLRLEAQAMLLRFLQEREVRPLGSTRTVTVDVRVLAATNRDLGEAIARREFRADLYDRLAEIVIGVAPLRERREDVPALVDHFLRLVAGRHGAAVPAMTPEARRALQAYDWPGNVRERVARDR